MLEYLQQDHACGDGQDLENETRTLDEPACQHNLPEVPVGRFVFVVSTSGHHIVPKEDNSCNLCMQKSAET